jgi:hypothetical protein
MRCVSRDGTTVVEVIRRSWSNHRDGEWIRVHRGGYHVADVRTVAELEFLGIDPADLSAAESLARFIMGHTGDPALKSDVSRCVAYNLWCRAPISSVA